MSVFFTSDLHLGHRLVSEIRGFEYPIDHDTAICDNWVSQVKAGDQVWVLGDVAVSSPRVALDLLRKLPGEKHLVAGNHDKVHPMHRDSHRQFRHYLTAFASVQVMAKRKVAGEDVLLAHLPYVGDTDGRDVDRYAEYRLRNLGYSLIHGHTHSKDRLTFALNEWGGRSIQYHVGLDAHDMKLVPLEELTATFAKLAPVAA